MLNKHYAGANTMKNALIVGCGNHMFEHILPVLVSHESIRPKWCFDKDLDKSNHVSKIFNITSLGANCNSISPDLIISAVRPSNSRDVLEIANRFRCPVFLEKPGGLNVEHIEELESFSNNLALDVWFGFNYRFSNVAKILKAAISEQSLISAEYEFFSRRPTEIENGELNLFECWLRGNAVHLFDFICMLHGSDISIESNSISIDDSSFIMTANFKDRNGCSIKVRLGNTTKKFHFTSSLLSGNGARVTTSGFDNVTWEHDGQSKELYKSSTFNKIRTKDGFYDQFTEMCKSDGYSREQFRIARNAMEKAEILFNSVPLTLWDKAA